MDLVEAIARSNGLTIWKLNDGRWQVSTKNRDGSFSVHIGDLAPTLQKALTTADTPAPQKAKAPPPPSDDDWRDLI